MEEDPTIAGIRKKNVRLLIDSNFKTQQLFADALGKTSGFVSNYMSENADRGIGSALAREIEECFGLSRGLLDTAQTEIFIGRRHDSRAPPFESPTSETSGGIYGHMGGSAAGAEVQNNSPAPIDALNTVLSAAGREAYQLLQLINGPEDVMSALETIEELKSSLNNTVTVAKKKLRDFVKHRIEVTNLERWSLLDIAHKSAFRPVFTDDPDVVVDIALPSKSVAESSKASAYKFDAFASAYRSGVCVFVCYFISKMHTISISNELLFALVISRAREKGLTESYDFFIRLSVDDGQLQACIGEVDITALLDTWRIEDILENNEAVVSLVSKRDKQEKK